MYSIQRRGFTFWYSFTISSGTDTARMNVTAEAAIGTPDISPVNLNSKVIVNII